MHNEVVQDKQAGVVSVVQHMPFESADGQPMQMQHMAFAEKSSSSSYRPQSGFQNMASQPAPHISVAPSSVSMQRPAQAQHMSSKEKSRSSY